MEENKRKWGKPHLDKFEKVLELIAEKGLSLRQACEKTKLHRRSFHEMVNDDADRRDRYARAREDREDFLLDEIYSIADDSTRDTVTKKSKNGDEYAEENHEWVNRSKLRVDVRKWHLSKMSPKKWGDRLELDAGENGLGVVINLDLGTDKPEEKASSGETNKKK